MSTAAYQVTIPTASGSFGNDANGNRTSSADGTQFEWDARNQLVSVSRGASRDEFDYSGTGMRLRQRRKVNGVLESIMELVWAGRELVERRLVGGETEHLAGPGKMVGTAARYYTQDHLGSVREVTDGEGALVGRATYGPFGEQTVESGELINGVSGHVLGPGGLVLAPYRVYDPLTGSWLSEDPVGLSAGINLYSYVENRPTVDVDPLGLVRVTRRERGSIHDVPDVDVPCHPKKPAGACSKWGGPAAGGLCVPADPDQPCGPWVVDHMFLITFADIFVFNGTFPFKGRAPKDKTVVDRASALAHEFSAHLDPAAKAAEGELRKVERKWFKNQAKCQKVKRKAEKRARDAYKM